MTDSTDNARGPERIWINKVHGQHPEDWDFTDGRHLTKKQLKAKTEYIRADLAPAPQDARVTALLEAVRHEREMVCQDMDMQMAASAAVDAALAAFDKGGKDD